MKQRYSFPLSSDPEFLPSVVMDRLERETGRRVVRLTVPWGQSAVYEVVLGEKKEVAE